MVTAGDKSALSKLTLTIDGQAVECPTGSTILEAADGAGIYIPRLCHHPDLAPAQTVSWADVVHQGATIIAGEKSGQESGEDAHCNLCLVQVEGQSQPVNSCHTPVETGMAVQTNTPAVMRQRKDALSEILADHPHACLTCAQKEGCSRTDCSSNVPVDERCCVLLGRCELEKVSGFIGIPDDTPRYVPRNRPVIKDDPLFDRDFNLCIGCLRCVRACGDLRGADILGAVRQDSRVRVGTKSGDGLTEAECRFCGACIEVCPTGALLDKETAKAVRRDAPLPCVDNCPAGIDIPRYVRLIALGREREALEIIRASVPFPAILGYVCFHPCEDACRRNDLDQPVAICALKRYAAETMTDEEYPLPEKAAASGKKIAIIGSGPAGMTAAYYLAIAGHQVELFDKEEKPGGMLRHGIPDYRLPPEILDRELTSLTRLEIQFHQNHRFGDGDDLDELKSQGFDAILLAVGTSVSKTLPIENADLAGIYLGLDFLKSAKLSNKPKLTGEVIIIGGGNVAIDAAMTALRLGADSVALACLESRGEMPAHDWEITQAEEEGVKIHPSWGPVKFVGEDGLVSGIEFNNCTVVFDNRGKFAPRLDQTKTLTLPATAVIVTIGQQVDPHLLESLGGKGVIEVNENSSPGPEWVFAAGDAVAGPLSVIDAIAAGRRVADTIDQFLGGPGIGDTSPEYAGVDDPTLGATDEAFQLSRQTAAVGNPDIRCTNFALIEGTLSEQAARHEAQRCLQCHLRQLISPVTLPPEAWLPLNEQAVKSVPDTEGVFQLLDTEKKAVRISGTANLRQELAACLENPGEARFFIWEHAPMFTKRESELIQQHLQKHGEMPGGGGDDDLDDLF